MDSEPEVVPYTSLWAVPVPDAPEMTSTPAAAEPLPPDTLPFTVFSDYPPSDEYQPRLRRFGDAA